MKVAIVTGGASGIGRALAEELARRGVDVVIGDRQVDLATEAAEAIRARGGRATAEELDVRRFEPFDDLVARTRGRTGRIDYLFNNAGIGVGGEISSYSLNDWYDVFDVNLRGVAHGVQAAYPVMREQGFGHIVNTASMAGLVTTPQGGYSATKHAVVGLSKALRIEARRHGVRVSALCPGVIRTPILKGGRYGRINVQGLTDDDIDRLLDRIRPMEPSDFARRALRQVDRDEPLIVVPSWWKAFWYLERISPSLSMLLWRRVLDEMRRRTETRS